ncbi:hypothetical protein [Streptomyces sp. CA-111067]|uniref:hypothetical protein n=1 Tax=Streptomyces sp. CA-111067 TaxID=3240046 RepID=UPI003D95CD9B
MSAGPGTDPGDAHGIGRRDLVKLLAAAGVAAAAGSAVAAAPASAAGLSPLDLHFTEVQKYRPFAVLSPFVNLDDAFTADTGARYDVLQPSPGETTGHLAVGDGRLSVGADRPFYSLLCSPTAQDAAYSTVVVDVESMIGDAAGQDSVFAGLVQDERNYVLGWYNNAAKAVGIDVMADGVLTGRSVTAASFTAPFRFSFQYTGNTGVVIADTGAGWDIVVWDAGVAGLLDLRLDGAAPRYRNAFGLRGDAGTISLGRVQAGYSGRTGLRDPNLVVEDGGAPYIRDGKLYLTATAAGTNGFVSSHTAVFTLDLADWTQLAEVGKVFVHRDGRVLGDHSARLVADPAGSGFHTYACTFGDGDVHPGAASVVYAPPQGDLLTGVHVVQGATRALDGIDASVVHLADGWYAAYRAQAGPTVARAVTPDFAGATVLGGNDDGGVYHEGTKLQRVGGQWYMLSGSEQDFRVYDMAAATVGTLDAPTGSPGWCAQPLLTPVPDGEGTRWLLITFNDVQYPGCDGSMGEFRVQSAGRTPGWEFGSDAGSGT